MVALSSGNDTGRGPRWSVVLAYYNEAAGIAATLTALAVQTVPVRLILVDNGSTDGSERVAREILGHFPHCDATFVREPVPCQGHALRTGLALVETEFVAIADADTWYPPHYLARAEALFARRGRDCVAVMANVVCEMPDRWRGIVSRVRRMSAAWLWPNQNHTAGPAQAFRMAALRAAGGYDPRLWPFVLKDQELMARVLGFGRQAYAFDHWCISSDRRRDRKAVRWTLWERLVYHFHPSPSRDWFFRDWLAPRLAKRGQWDIKLRERPWETVSGRPAASPRDKRGPWRDYAPDDVPGVRVETPRGAATH